jgi:hypothetical protein
MFGLAWIMILLFVLPYIAGMTDAHHHGQPLVQMGSHELFAQPAQPGLRTILHLISASQIARIAGMNHCALPTPLS